MNRKFEHISEMEKIFDSIIQMQRAFEKVLEEYMLVQEDVKNLKHTIPVLSGKQILKWTNEVRFQGI